MAKKKQQRIKNKKPSAKKDSKAKSKNKRILVKKVKDKQRKKIVKNIQQEEKKTVEINVKEKNNPQPTQPSPKAIARAKAALLAKEKQKHVAQPTDKAAYEKQLKLVEPKSKLVLEYIIHASPVLLYEFITSPSGLSEWFADNVNINGSMYSFYWDGSEQTARVLAIKENKFIRFQWTDRLPNTYFELRIEKNELTEELSLIITDFAENVEEMSSLEVLWQGQVQRLMKVIGSKI